MTTTIFLDLDIIITGEGKLHILLPTCDSQICTMVIFVKKYQNPKKSLAISLIGTSDWIDVF